MLYPTLQLPLCPRSLNEVHTRAYYLQMFALSTGSQETDVSHKVTGQRSKPSSSGHQVSFTAHYLGPSAMMVGCSVPCRKDNFPPWEQIKHGSPISRHLHPWRECTGDRQVAATGSSLNVLGSYVSIWELGSQSNEEPVLQGCVHVTFVCRNPTAFSKQ